MSLSVPFDRRSIALVPVAVIFVLPLAIMILTSLKSAEEVAGSTIFALPISFNWESWSEAWGSTCIGNSCSGLKPYFVNSLIITVPATIISVLIGMMNGYALAQWRGRSSDSLTLLFTFATFVPFQCIIVPIAQFLAKIGLFGSVGGLILVHVIYSIPLLALLFRNAFVDISADLVKGARIDGCGYVSIFRHVYLPLAVPVMAMAAMLQFTFIWNDFLFGLVFSGRDYVPVTVALNNLVNATFGVKLYNVHMAAAIIAGAPTLIVYLLAGKMFVRGLSAGAVKG